VTANLADLQTIAATGTGALALAGTTPVINVGSDGGLTISAPISGSVAWSKTGTGALTTTGAVSTSAGITVSAGTWNLNGTLASATGTLTVSANATLVGGATPTISKAISAAANSTVTLNGATSGALTIDTRNFTLQGSSVTSTAATCTIGSASGAVGVLTIAGTRTLTLGNLTLVTAGASGSIRQTSGNLNRSATSGLYLSAAANTYGHYKGTGGTMGSTGSRGTFSTQQGVLEFAGVAFNSTYINGIWLGTSGAFNGSTAQAIFSSGTNSINGLIALGFSTETTGHYEAVISGSSLTAIGGLQFNGSSGKALVAINGSGTLETRTAPTAQTPAVSGVHLNSGKFVVTNGSNHTSGAITLFGSGNQLSGGGAAASGAISTPIAAATGNGITAVSGGTGGADYIGPPAVRLIQSGSTPSTAIVTANIDGTGAITGYTIQSPGFGMAAAPTATLVGGGFTSAASAPTFTIGAVSTDGAIEKVDAGTLALAATNTYTGGTTVTAGTLSIGNGATSGTLGSSGAGDVAVGASGTLNFNHGSGTVTYSGTMSGSGALTKTTSTGIDVLTGNNSGFTGTVTITTGELRAGHSNALGTGAGVISVASGGVLGLTGDITISRGATIAGTGVSSVGAIRNVSGSNTISGPITLSATGTSIGSDAGTLFLTSASAITGNTYTLAFVGAGDVDVSPAISTGTGTVTKSSGAGAAILRGTSTYTGTTTASTGYLGYTGSIAASTNGNFGNAASAVVVAQSAGLRYYGTGSATFSRSIQFTGATVGATYKLESNGSGAVDHSVAPSFATTNTAKNAQFGGTGTGANTISYLVANNGTGAVTLIKADAGKWILSNTGNTYTGGTTVSGGTLQLKVATWAANATVTGPSATAGLVSVAASATIQTLSGTGASAQLGRHTYRNLTFAANARIRIGG